LDLPFQLDEEFSTLRNLNESEILAKIPVPYETRARYVNSLFYFIFIDENFQIQ